MLENFYAEHPDFGLNATFYVLPAADPPHNLFGQDEYQQAKLQYLVSKGFEIGNHTYWHQQLTELSAADVEEQIGKANQVVTEMVPGYRERTFALPLGEWPLDKWAATAGSYDGVDYKFDAVMMAGSDPASPPGHIDYDAMAIPRVQVLEETFSVWMEGPLAPGSELRYVSDGNPDTVAFPESMKSQLNADALEGKQIFAY
jgi:peptidoglycan/xylan/chitin deacetylase (PgdA/CDA1 family)